MAYSAQELTPSTLYIVSTPIGNLGDMTARARDVLAAADVVLAEDTRVTRKLLTHLGISTTIERFDENTAVQRAPHVLAMLAGGATVALVSDAGTPGVSDPGSHLVALAKEAGVTVIPIPGASAILAALVASGLPTDTFYFAGFLPRKAGERQRLLETLSVIPGTLIFYESPHRTVASLDALAQAFPQRRGTLARELTKLYEEIITLPLPELAQLIKRREILKGEVVLLVGPPDESEQAVVDDEAIAQQVQSHIAQGLSKSAAVKLTASKLGVSKNRVYELSLRL